MSYQTTSTARTKFKFAFIGFIVAMTITIMLYFIFIYEKIVPENLKILTARIYSPTADNWIGKFRGDLIYTLKQFPKAFLIEKKFLDSLTLRRYPTSTVTHNAVVLYPCKKYDDDGNFLGVSMVFAGCDFTPSGTNPDEFPSPSDYFTDSTLLFQHVFPCPNDCPDIWGR